MGRTTDRLLNIINNKKKLKNRSKDKSKIYKKYRYSNLTKSTSSIANSLFFDDRNIDVLNLISKASDFNRYCFLCGEFMTKPSKEHVIPQWILKTIDLYNQRAKLPNNSTFPFRKLTIPCCKECNNEDLSILEKNIKLIFEKDAKSISNRDNELLFYWMLKIYLALAIKATKLKNDITKRDSKGILSVEELNQLRPLFALMTTFINPTKFYNFKPYSLFTFDIDIQSFDRKIAFLNNPSQPSLLFCLNGLGVMCYFNDDGIIKDIYLENYLEDIERTIDFHYLIDIYSSGLASMQLTSFFKRGYSIKKSLQSLSSIKTTLPISKKIEGFRLRNDELKMKYKKYNLEQL